MDARQVKDALASQAESVCAYLFPAGRRNGHDWEIGSIEGEKGKSMKICLSGTKAGVWCDFKNVTMAGSNLLDLWMQARKLPFVEALKEAKAWLGVPDTGPSEKFQRYEAPVKKNAPAESGRMKELQLFPAKPDGAVWRYLTGRKIRPEAIEAYRIGEARFEMNGHMRDFVVFPFFTADGKLARLKFRDIDDKKCMFQKPSLAEAGQYAHGYQKLLFGWQAIGKEDQQVAITEGEIDALSMYGEGVKALSLPEGAQPKGSSDSKDELSDSHKAWLEHDYDALEQFTDILMALDMDEPGKKATEALAPRLGIHRLRVVDFVLRKDANEALMNDELEACISEAEEMRPPELKRPKDFEQDIWDEFFPSEDRKGLEMPWAMPFRFMPGQLTIWHGYNGSGKTVCMTYVMMRMAHAHNKRICIASMEMPASKTFKNALRQAIGFGRPWGFDPEKQRDTFRIAVQWLDDRFWVYDKLGEVAVEDVLAVFEYACRRYGVEHFVLDSLMMLRGQGATDQELYSAQRDVVKALKDFAVQYKVHVHLVAHSKKPDAKNDSRKAWPNKFQISGSANLSNIADNVVCVFRHELKEEKLSQAGYNLSKPNVQQDEDEKAKWEEQIREWKDREDSLFIVQKQRETGEMPSKRLYFDYGPDGSWQYLEEVNKRDLVRCFVPGLEDGWRDVHELRSWKTNHES